ncbi:MAG TPA: hypothetical protein DCE42_09560 [Myxococcales bacterium]|nr:hypothetical protein [Deltaproteobacteria bacterium]MBU51630.1 hypothetical protein [Deltaproteobacteria bacterium]HAA54993.1 hypothetical protein [Myxococcales bacterium]|tara:strand:+ start:6396 stop:6992 length:597 start_codon:yes stop_codon:yes gene_type:complete
MEAGLDPLQREWRYVRQAQSGQQAGIAGLYKMHAERLYRQVIFPTLVDQAAAEDVLKETFITCIKQIQSFQWDESKGIFPWLARIARNRALDVHRRTSREHRGKGAYRQEIDGLAPVHSAQQIMEEEEEKQRLKEQVALCLDDLNPRYKLALELRLFQELPRAECARRLQVQVATFDVLFHRALRAFRKQWESKESST